MIHHGDCLTVLASLPAASVDACVTDPPYELGFMGKAWDGSGVAVQPQTWAAVARVLKPGAYLLAFGGTRTYHRMTCAIEDAGFEIRDCLSWLYGSGFPKSLNLPGGLGTALKPSWEPCVLARKPLVGTVAANVERFGTGAINIDACRIEATDNTTKAERFAGSRSRDDYRTGTSGPSIPTDVGRWPANVLLDEEAAALLDEQTGELASGSEPVRGFVRRADADRRVLGGFHGQSVGDCAGALYGDSGGASRFYYVAKPSREERDYGTDGLTARQRDESRKAGNPGGDNPRNRGVQLRGNHHPTVKPVELMRWLVRLVTPPGGTVLDPFMGSGTTGMACRYELREFIGIEREADYIQIAERRIAAVAPLFAEVSA